MTATSPGSWFRNKLILSNHENMVKLLLKTKVTNNACEVSNVARDKLIFATLKSLMQVPKKI